jgi:hypothetical protein
MTTGENDNTWGDQTNDNLKRLENKITGYAAVTLSGTTHTLTFTDNPTSYTDEDGRNFVLNFGGSPGGTCTVTIPARETVYLVLNNTADSNTITLTTGSGTTFNVPAGKDAFVYSDGTNVYNAMADAIFSTITGDGSALTGVLHDVVDDTTPELGGNLSTNGNDINFGDNDKAQFGASNDLQIYHNGTHSYISDQGTGNLVLQASNSFKVENSGGTETYIFATENGAVELKHDNSTKISTTSTGVDVTGTVEFGDSHTIGNDASDNLEITSSSAENIIYNSGGGIHVFKNNGTETLRIDNTKLGIGRNSFDSDDGLLAVGALSGASTPSILSLYGNNSTAYGGNEVAVSTIASYTDNTAFGSRLIFKTNDSSNVLQERLRISTSDVVVNEGSADVDFRVESNNYTNMLFVNGGDDRVFVGKSNYNSLSSAVLKVNDNQSSGFSGIWVQNLNSTAGSEAGIGFGGFDYANGAIVGSRVGNPNGRVIHYVNVGGGPNTIANLKEAMRIESVGTTTSQIVMNEQSLDQDFRVESNGNTHALFVDGGNNRVGILNSSPSQALDVTGTVLADKAFIAEATLTDGATISWNMSTQSVAKVTLGGNRTLAAPTNGSTGQFCSLNVIQDGTGSRTLTWNAVFEFKDDTAPTLTTTGGKGDIFVFRYNGSKWLEVGRNLNISQS